MRPRTESAAKRSMDFGDWARKQVGRLQEPVDRVRNIKPQVVYGPKGEWIVAKLLVLGYWVDVYTRIMSNQIRQGRFDSMYYIDLLAGSGLCSVQRDKRTTSDVIAGSSIVAATYCHEPFAKYILVESSPDSGQVLQERMRTLVENVSVFPRDCNECIDNVLAELTPRSHYLAFVDNEGADVKWSAMQKLIQKNGDIWITFQTSLIRRPSESSSIRQFLGLHETDQMPHDMLSYYSKKIENAGRIVKIIHVPGTRGFSYDLVFVTRSTGGGSPWLNIVDRLKEKVERLNIDFIRVILDQLAGRQEDLRGLS
jgi:three-Cys-motif partner protein